MEKFIRNAARAGVDGLLVLDLPPEESDNSIADEKIRPLPYLSSRRRRRRSAWNSSSSAAADLFITFSREGVTGMQTKVASNSRAAGFKIRAHTAIAGGRRLWRFQSANRPSSSRKTRTPSSSAARGESNRGKWKIKRLGQAVGEFVKSLADAVKTI